VQSNLDFLALPVGDAALNREVEMILSHGIAFEKLWAPPSGSEPAVSATIGV
jgi:hypothetical protein